MSRRIRKRFSRGCSQGRKEVNCTTGEEAYVNCNEILFISNVPSAEVPIVHFNYSKVNFILQATDHFVTESMEQYMTGIFKFDKEINNSVANGNLLPVTKKGKLVVEYKRTKSFLLL